ncbi:MAG: hypothetical protein ACK53K_08465, partial [Burkholderiales bacterium]
EPPLVRLIPWFSPHEPHRPTARSDPEVVASAEPSLCLKYRGVGGQVSFGFVQKIQSSITTFPKGCFPKGLARRCKASQGAYHGFVLRLLLKAF